MISLRVQSRVLAALIVLTATCVGLTSIPALLTVASTEHHNTWDGAGMLFFFAPPLVAYAFVSGVYAIAGHWLTFLEPFVTWMSVLALAGALVYVYRFIGIARGGLDLEVLIFCAVFIGALSACGIASIVHSSGVLQERAE